jgi:hypothetical protein
MSESSKQLFIFHYSMSWGPDGEEGLKIWEVDANMPTTDMRWYSSCSAGREAIISPRKNQALQKVTQAIALGRFLF